ncbi:hypothetical protein [Corallococcus sp. 4LFB]|uniref:hypothetical protein n=1 Tax=Corallococcus sp. 4LFB TaxID=3383249 RepID=UPI003975F553
MNKLLLMMGNGAERVPTPEDGIHIWPRPENNPRVFSLDAYMRMVPYGVGPNHESLEGKTVVVHGGNAAIDAVQQSQLRKEWETVFGVTWPSESQRHRPPRPVRERPRVSGGQSCQVEFLGKGGGFKDL